MDLNYIPPSLSKKQIIQFYESKSFVDKGSRSHRVVMNTLAALHKLPDEAFSEQFEKFSAENPEELMAKFNMRSYAYARAIDENINDADANKDEGLLMQESYKQFSMFLEFTARVLSEGKIIFPCVIDIPNDEIINRQNLE